MDLYQAEAARGLYKWIFIRQRQPGVGINGFVIRQSQPGVGINAFLSGRGSPELV